MDPGHLITAHFEDGASYSFECRPNEDILTAALRQQVTLLCSCRKAFCGSCKAVCIGGDYEFGERVNVQVLSPREEEDGVVVACDTFPRSDMTLAFPYTSDRLGMAVANHLDGRIVRVERLSETVYKLQLQALDPTTGQPMRFNFEPGQYVELSIPDSQQTRAFSLSNLPDDSGLLDFLIRIIPKGFFSTYLEEWASPGQHLKLRGPLGQFTLSADPKAANDAGSQHGAFPYAFVGGSTGLAPLISMLRELARQGHPGECHLFFGMQDSRTMYYEGELRKLASSMKQLTLHLALMDPPEGWSGFKGSAVTAFERYCAGLGDKPEVYMCGPAPMVEAVQGACERLGIPDSRIHREEFVASGG